MTVVLLEDDLILCDDFKNVIENIEQFLPTPFNNQNSKIIEIIENYIDNN